MFYETIGYIIEIGQIDYYSQGRQRCTVVLQKIVNDVKIKQAIEFRKNKHYNRVKYPNLYNIGDQVKIEFYINAEKENGNYQNKLIARSINAVGFDELQTA